MFLIVIGIGILIIWIYILFAREWLDQKFQGTPYAYWHEQIEDKLWQKSRTILMGQAYVIGGIIVALNAFAAQAGFDVTPILTEIANLIPTEKYRGLILALIVAIWSILTGWSIVYLRKQTTTPVEGE